MCSNAVEEVLEQTGRWGRFQLCYYLCMAFVIVFSSFPLSYIFTARDVQYRCLIPECENVERTTYNPEWLAGFVPFKEKSPNKCLRYASVNNTCSNKSTIKNVTVKCDTFVYQRSETTIVHDFNINCDENLWKLTIIGALNEGGELVCLGYTGIISDKYGRKYLMVVSVMLSTCIGLLRSFSLNYFMYAFLEFLDSAIGGAMYSSAFVLVLEIAGQKDRNLANLMFAILYTLGIAFVGLVAWLTPGWRLMLRYLYAPGVVSILFFRTVPESVRWLLSVNKKDEAVQVIKEIARINGRQISDGCIEKLMQINQKDLLVDGVDGRHLEVSTEDANESISSCDKTDQLTVAIREEDGQSNVETFPSIMSNKILKEYSNSKAETVIESMRNRTLLFRLLQCSFTWIACTFTYYGLTLHSVNVSENAYLSFTSVVLIEIPANLVYYYYDNKKIGRRRMMCITLILSGMSSTVAAVLPEDCYWWRLCAFLIGKGSSTVAYTVIYVYTAEMFPTCSRHSMLNVCSMFGRVGAMIAPQVPLLARVSKVLPLIMFGIITTAAGALALLFPETLDTRLPDTIEEAVNIGSRFDCQQENGEAGKPLNSKMRNENS